ncbi:ROK family protein [Occultella glacieicola]|uniref:ROK family protein n=1 Tax=Occultella glacieicola TaxID=2518684 RepID=A0ABY2E1V4_9MICO|nr:ROK family protein [Occultella glacieicola]TDE92556.1 ROK family protein [Occultella glacieicola]
MPAHAVAVDVGGTTIKAGRVDATGQLTRARRVPTPRDIPALVEAIGTLVRELAEPGDAVGVVVPGIVDEATGTAVLSVNLGWRDVPLRTLLVEDLGRDVTFGHDVRAGALAESVWGVGGDLLFVPVGTGIAAALVLDGRVRGTGWAGEIGMLTVSDPDGGGPVVLESVASAAGIARRYAARAGVAVDGADAVVEAADGGDLDAIAVLGDGMDALGPALADAVALLGPVPIVVGGGLAGGGESVFGPLREAITRRLGERPASGVIAARLGPWAGCLGAGAFAMGLSTSWAEEGVEP